MPPFGERLALGHLHAEHLMDQRCIAERISPSRQASRQLQIEEIAGRASGPQPAQPHFFAAGMDDDDARRIDDELPKAIDRSSRQRIDEIEASGRRHLHQAQARMVGVLAYKLRIESEMGTFR